MCSRCWCQSEVPSVWKRLLKAPGSGCLKLSGMSQTTALSRSALAMPSCRCSGAGCLKGIWFWVMLGRMGLCQGLQLEPRARDGSAAGQILALIYKQTQTRTFSPKNQKRGGKSSSLTSVMAEKMRTLSFINTKLGPVTPPGSPRSQSKASWTVLPPQSCPGRAAGWHLCPGLGGDLLSLPSQQREKIS